MIVLTQTFDFNGEGQAKLFRDDEFEIASQVLKESYECYLTEEYDEENKFDKEKSFCYEDYGHAKAVYEDGTYAEWQIIFNVVQDFK